MVASAEPRLAAAQALSLKVMFRPREPSIPKSPLKVIDAPTASKLANGPRRMRQPFATSLCGPLAILTSTSE